MHSAEGRWASVDGGWNTVLGVVQSLCPAKLHQVTKILLRSLWQRNQTCPCPEELQSRGVNKHIVNPQHVQQ